MIVLFLNNLALLGEKPLRARNSRSAEPNVLLGPDQGRNRTHSADAPVTERGQAVPLLLVMSLSAQVGRFQEGIA
jgi:hypothetical protein